MKIWGQKPEARSFHSAVSVGNKLVVIGGRGTQNQHFADVHVFDCGSYSVLYSDLRFHLFLFPTVIDFEL